MNPKEVLYLDPFLRGSHKNFFDNLSKYSLHEWTSLSIDKGAWKWVSRFSGHLLGQQFLTEFASSSNKVDLIVASDYVDLNQFLASIKKFAPQYPLPPLIFYMHENQLSYPLHGDEQRDLQYGITNLLSMTLADEVWFNSYWHMSDWQEHSHQLAKKIPWGPRQRWYLEREKRRVVYPGVNIGGGNLDRKVCDPIQSDTDPLFCDRNVGPRTIIWNHRWEFDKNPDFFIQVLNNLLSRNINFQLIICGQGSKKALQHPLWQTGLESKLIHVGEVSCRADYEALLKQGDIVFSSAEHEFFGISIIESILAGCLPVLPNRLSYPELVPKQNHAEYLYTNLDEATALVSEFISMDQNLFDDKIAYLRKVFRYYRWEQRISEFDQLINDTI